MARLIRVLALILIVVFAVSACSASNSSEGSYDDYDGSSSAPADDESGEFTGGSVRHMIYEAYLAVSVLNVDQAMQNLTQRAEFLGGYVSGSVRDQSGDLPSARITYRIPQAKYSEFLAYARVQGEPGRESVNSTDVTEDFVDLEARLANRLVHEERLLLILTETASVQELLAVEQELARIREDIEVIQGRLRYLTDRTTMSRVEISLTQLPGETDIPGLRPLGIRETLRRSLRALVTSSTLFLDVISFIFIALAAILPFAIPLILLVWIIIKLRRRSKSKSHEA